MPRCDGSTPSRMSSTETSPVSRGIGCERPCREREGAPAARARRHLLLDGGGAGLVGVASAAGGLLFVFANKLTTAANTVFLQATNPLFVVALAPWLLRERGRGRGRARCAG